MEKELDLRNQQCNMFLEGWVTTKPSVKGIKQRGQQARNRIRTGTGTSKELKKGNNKGKEPGTT